MPCLRMMVGCSIKMRKATVSVLLILIFSSNSNCQVISKAAVIDTLLNQCLKKGIFNGIALVADEGEVILHKSYGNSNFDRTSPLKLSDRFYIGSLTKQFTSALIFVLQEEGFLSINDPLSKHLPEFDSPEYEQITIHHLLTHTSGLDNYTSFPEFNRGRNYSEEEFLAFIRKPLLFEPGSRWNYSNTGYYLLGLIAQRASNKTYGELLDQKIFAPLKMKNTAFDTTWIQDNVAHGFFRTIDGMRPKPNYSLSTLFASGGIYSTAEDLFKWDQALYTNQLLSDSSKSILFKPIKKDYACGWYVKKGIENNQPYERHFHGGWLKGYHAFLLRRIPPRQVVILLDNSYSQELQTIKNRIWSALIEEEIRDIKPKLSNLLYDACANNALDKVMDSVSNHLGLFENHYNFEEFDINTVAYRLMEAERYSEASILFSFNLNRYPESWNAYDSMGELQLIQGNYQKAEKLYEKSLVLNPQNNSAKRALKKIKQRKAKSKQN